MQPAPRPRPAPPRPVRTLAIAALLLAALAWPVWHGALDFFFAQDDFVGLARATGLLPRLAGPWRLWSNQLHFDLLLALGGLEARHFHAANLAAHVLAAVALFALLARRVDAIAAFAGAALVVTHPAAFTALHWVSAIGDPLALALALLALLLAERPGRIRWCAVPVFAAALLAKESILPLPLVAIVVRHFGPPRGARAAGRAPLVLPHELALLALAAAYGAGFVAADVVGVRTGVGRESAYALGLGMDALRHLAMLLGWTANFVVFTYPVRFDNVDPRVYPWAIGFAVLLAAGCASRPLRARGWLGALALYLLFLLPVLPLRHHVYRYFLVAPLAGIGWALAAALDALPLGRRALGIGVALLAVALAANGALVVRWAERAPSSFPYLLADPTADRERIARNLLAALQQARLRPGTPLVFLAPRLRPDSATASPARLAGLTAYFEDNLRSAIADSLAVRLFVPAAGPLTFVRQVGPAPPQARWVLYAPDGTCWLGTRAELDSLAAHGATGP